MTCRDRDKLDFLKKGSVKILILIVIGFLSIAWTVFEMVINKIEETAMITISTNNIKNKKDIIRLKAKHKKEIAELKLKNKRDVAKIKLKARSKAKIQRVVSVIPVAGLAAFAVFENMEFEDWKKDYPEGSFEEYSRQTTEAMQTLLEEEYHDFSENYGALFEALPNQLSQSTMKNK